MSDLSEENYLEKAWSNGASRRAVLGGIAAATTGLGGCQSNDNSPNNDDDSTETADNTAPEENEPADNTSTDTNSTANNSTPTEDNSTEEPFTGEIQEFQFSTTSNQINIPGAWTNEHKLEDYHVNASIEVEANQDLGNITLEKNDQTVQTWEEQSQNFTLDKTIKQENLEEGRNQLTLDLGQNWNQEIGETQRSKGIDKTIPESYVADLIDTEGNHITTYQTPF